MKISKNRINFSVLAIMKGCSGEKNSAFWMKRGRLSGKRRRPFLKT